MLPPSRAPFALLLGLFVPALTLTAELSGCQNEAVCLSCPDMSGLYTMTFGQDTSIGSCTDFVPNESTQFTVTQQGATVSTTLYGIPLSGSLFANGQTILSGSAPTAGIDGGVGTANTLSMDGTYSAPDGGTGATAATFQGNLEGNFSQPSGIGATGSTCTLQRAFDATRTN